jgi:hypothetical protein
MAFRGLISQASPAEDRPGSGGRADTLSGSKARMLFPSIIKYARRSAFAVTHISGGTLTNASNIATRASLGPQKSEVPRGMG